MSERGLEEIAEALIARVTRGGAVREGVVMSAGAAPYRRLDCDGRALAYVKTRPRKRAVRIDISALWVSPDQGRALRSAIGAALLVRTEREALEVADFLVRVVETTRAVQNRRQGNVAE